MMDRDRTSNNRCAAESGAVSYIAAMMAWVRTFVIWLLVLALPVQGAAAATMALCNPNRHGTLGAVPPHDHGPVETALHVPQHLHEHPGVGHGAGQERTQKTRDRQAHLNLEADGAISDTDSGAVVASGKAPAQKLAQADQHSCSACASCCSAAAFSSAVVKVPAPQFEPTEFSALVPAVERFASGGPDRPPRTLVA